MEVAFLFLEVSQNNPSEFTQQLQYLFPLAVIDILTLKDKKILVLYNDIKSFLDQDLCQEEIAYALESGVVEFSNKYPYLELVYVYVIGCRSMVFSEGFVLKNRKKIIQNSGTKDAYLVLLQEILPIEEDFFKDLCKKFL
ncbi:hypothetical protein ACYSNX_05665 [Myroides sp. LJL115]